MGQRLVAVIGGLVLALGMGVLLLFWVDRGEGAGVTGFLYMVGIAAGIVSVLVGALRRE